MSKVTELARTSSVAKGDDEGGGERGSQTIRCPVRIVLTGSFGGHISPTAGEGAR
jgi:hypothetical protein